MSLPRVLSLGPENELVMEVAPELASLRQKTEGRNIPNRAGEVVCTFKAGEETCGLELQLGGESLFSAAYSQANGAPFVAIGDRLLPLSPDRDGFSTLHLWIDGSVIEIFLDKRQAITTRSYALPAEPGEIRVVWNGASNLLKSLDVFGIKPISSDRLTT
jgi:beta-fructofuranosidase